MGWPLQVWKRLMYAELSAPSHMLAAAAAVAVHGNVASMAPQLIGDACVWCQSDQGIKLRMPAETPSHESEHCKV